MALGAGLYRWQPHPQPFLAHSPLLSQVSALQPACDVQVPAGSFASVAVGRPKAYRAMNPEMVSVRRKNGLMERERIVFIGKMGNEK